MTETTTDFCVVGAGPAGLTLALLLLRSGARVTVLERTRNLDREYRGEILQPGGMTVLAELGVLAAARERGAYEHSRFRLLEGDRALLDIDYRRLPGPYNCLLSIPQRHVLEELLAQCGRYEEFTYLEGTRLSRLLTAPDGAVHGAVGTGPQGSRVVRAHCVVGADGRYSKTRRLAEIPHTRLESFDYDVLWFKVSRESPADEVRIHRTADNPVLAYDSYPGAVQLGWTVPHKGYQEIAAQGVDAVKERIRRAVPQYADRIDTEVRSLSDLTLLDVFAARADEWVRDGLVLIGDAAHTHSPIGAQGINLAIQDAVVLHPVLMASLREKDASAVFLGAFTGRRGADIDKVMRLQVLQSRAMLSRNKLASVVRPRAAKLLSHTGLYPKILRRIAYGTSPIRIAAELFTTDGPAAG